MNDETHTDVDFEMEDEQGVGALKEKIAKLKDELEQVKKERQENLDGWQRCRADAANMSRDTKSLLDSARSRAQEDMVEEILSVLDGFDMAMGGEAWTSVSETWRKGIEYIHSQLLGVLSQHGVERYGKVGDAFDHALHEALEEQEHDASTGVIVRVVRSGYRSATRLIRPAQVIVGK
jgi:molecular chaperone GrpE